LEEKTDPPIIKEPNVVSNQTPYNVVLLFGGPGCGKGTQGKALSGLPNVKHLAMGDIFRALDPSSDIGREFLSYSNKGLLVPDELTVRVWKWHVTDLVNTGDVDPHTHILLLDGIPRTTAQVEQMACVINVLKIIHLVVKDEAVLIERLKGRALKSNRPDDAHEDVIKERLNVYRRTTEPVLNAYHPGLIAEINGDQNPFAVLRDIADVLAVTLQARVQATATTRFGSRQPPRRQTVRPLPQAIAPPASPMKRSVSFPGANGPSASGDKQHRDMVTARVTGRTHSSRVSTL